MRKTIICIIVSLIGFQARSEKFSYQVHDATVIGTDTSLICILDGEEIPMDLPEGMRLKGIKGFGEGVIAITSGKHILFWDSPLDKARRLYFDTKGNLSGLDARGDICYAVTDSSELISLNQALQGKIFDFNANYSDYYGNLNIIGVAVGPVATCIAAVRDDGSPAAFVSSKGSVWSERELNYAVDGKWYIFKKVPHGIAYEELSYSFVLLCEEEVRFHLPMCSHCNFIE